MQRFNNKQIIKQDCHKHPDKCQIHIVSERIAICFFDQNPKNDDYSNRHNYPADHIDRHNEKKDHTEHIANEPENKSPDNRFYIKLFVHGFLLTIIFLLQEQTLQSIK